ncbi:M14 family metallopeptidase [Pseudomonas sp. GD04058]|uniref:M14 family metallopeptidase n=1 Tax=Pseudomonas sp. GD04058 TaxID=2975429 RepID=UPI00244CDAC0|nr:M14 family metallopeptidase [Pseudomonas sp. GD04058]MDG9884394.1 M14 family metallopeptidase [Pseudomonas sp. GD04058]
MTSADCFSQTYAQARQTFLQACAALDLPVESYTHPLPGSAGEELAVDVARSGPADAEHVLLITSGCHGVEGFCGSAVQIDLLRDRDFLRLAGEARCAVVFVHAANPWGFSWLRRWTHENVDLNRNFRDFSQPCAPNPDYAALHPVMIPRQWPPSLGNRLRLLSKLARRGRKHLQKAISGGQSSHPDGLFYTGTAPTWSNRTLREILRRHGRACAHLVWLDIHTGLGPKGYGERIYSGPGDSPMLARARRWWGDAVRSSQDGQSVSVPLTGLMVYSALEECAPAEFTGLTLEYGTLPGEQVLDALRAEQWLHNNPQAGAAQRRRIKQQLRDAFYVDEPQWKEDVLRQGREVARQALAGLAS